MTSTKLANKLMKMKEQIEEAKVEKNREEGKLEELLKQLKKEFKCKNLNEAKKILVGMEREIDKEEDALEKGINKLEESYEW